MKNLLQLVFSMLLKNYSGADETFISKDTKFNPNKIEKGMFDSMEFTPDVQAITNKLKAGTSYTVNVPNTKAFKKDQEGTTGFEDTAEDDPLGKTQTGSSGGYYSNGYIRLIYIIDNANRTGYN